MVVKVMDNLGIAKLLAEDCWLVVWKDPTEGDRSWKTEFDGKASVNVDVGWMLDNPNDPDEYVLFRSRSIVIDEAEKGSEIYIPKGCIVERYRLTLHGEGERFETTTTTIRKTN